MQGWKSRKRTPDDIERLIRMNLDQGVSWFFITDDNFARNKDWESIFDRITEVRRGVKGTPRDLKIIIQVDTLCHKNPNFITKAKLAGVRRVFIGLETINPANLAAAKKRQNKVTEYRQMLLAWKHAGVITYAGDILGFPNDTPESIAEDIAIIQKELPLDILEFFCLSPFPGSEHHQKLWKRKVQMDADMNRYDAEHVVTDHPRMTRAQWEEAYRTAWKHYYGPEHIERLLRRRCDGRQRVAPCSDDLRIRRLRRDRGRPSPAMRRSMPPRPRRSRCSPTTRARALPCSTRARSRS